MVGGIGPPALVKVHVRWSRPRVIKKKKRNLIKQILSGGYVVAIPMPLWLPLLDIYPTGTHSTWIPDICSVSWNFHMVMGSRHAKLELFWGV